MPTDPQSASPYDALQEAGIGVESTMKDVRDASYYFMERRRWTPEVRRAWDELRTVEGRLAADLRWYDVDGEVARVRHDALAGLRNERRCFPPVEVADLRGLLDDSALEAFAGAPPDPPGRPLPGHRSDPPEFDR